MRERGKGRRTASGDDLAQYTLPTPRKRSTRSSLPLDNFPPSFRPQSSLFRTRGSRSALRPRRATLYTRRLLNAPEATLTYSDIIPSTRNSGTRQRGLRKKRDGIVSRGGSLIPFFEFVNPTPTPILPHRHSNLRKIRDTK